MSQFEDYDATSANYDKTRVPVGVEILLRLLAESSVPIMEQRVLDAGCGTGNYTGIFSGLVKHVTGVDANEGMLKRAREKLSRNDNVDLKQWALPEIPFEDASFDTVSINQVVHHMDPAGGFAELKELVAESFRVLKPGGLVVFNTSTQDQLEEGCWYFEFIPVAAAVQAARYAPVNRLNAILTEAGFSKLSKTIPYDEVLQGDAYFRPDGPIHKEWRDGDSVWSLTTPDELEAAVALVTKMRKAGTLRAFIENHNEVRLKVGQCVFVSAVKSR